MGAKGLRRKVILIRFRGALHRLRNDLGLQLLGFYLLLVVPIVIAALFFDRLAGERLERDVRAADLALARAIAQETDTSISIALDSVRQLATYPAVIEADREGMLALFQRVQSVKPDVNLIYRLGPDGIMLFHYPMGPGSTLGVDFSFRGYFQRALQTHEPLVSLGRISPTTEQPVATAVMPLWSDQGEFLGLVATNIKLQSLSDTLASIVTSHPTEERMLVLIVDAAGKVIAHPDPRWLLTDLSQILPQVLEPALAGESGSLVRPGPEGEETLYTYVPVSSAGWAVIVSRPTAVAFATQRAMHQGVLSIIAVFLAIGIFFWWALASRVLRPLEQLADYSQRLGRGTPPPDDGVHPLAAYTSRPDQMGHLIRSFTRMESAIRARINELSTLLQTSAAVVSTLDSSVVLERILEQLERLLGIRMSAIVQWDEARGVFRARATRGLSRRYAEQLVIDPNERASVTLRALRSGEPVQVSDTEKNPAYVALRPRARAEGYRSIMAIPLNTVHAPPSALVLYSPQPRTFSEREMDLLASFANHAAMAMENAALFARSDARLQEQTRRLEALIQSMEDGLLLEDLEGRILYANRRVCDLLGIGEESLRGQSVRHLAEQLVARAVEPGEARSLVERFLMEAGPEPVEIALRGELKPRYIRLRGFTVTDAYGEPLGRGQILQDITRRHELDRMKSSLIATVSHELRTPLAAIMGYATTLLAEDVKWEPEAQREFLAIISAEADRLSALVDNLLDMSRLEAGNLELSRTYCDLAELAQRGLQRAFPPPGERMQLDFPPDLPPLFVDAPRIEAVLRNLIENAAKYAPGSPIRVSAERRDGEVIVRVEDQGPGIPGEEQERIFRSFYRLRGREQGAGGFGLGLAICQGFVQAHGGRIWLETRKRGTCVAFSLPLDVQEDLSMEDAPSAQEAP
jgi:PAS domain S-box-containing protein